ncbi:GntR family transcriptional regulator [Starkeya sp. ORNL1]|uniref:GntR family transcriptional regulator n=1 Tax=Starkeya sp. ORNL1 TaxID=2709380 RepID=UPI0014641E38|nr:GntR family transcriptional regulator [Starkeya sp. ORNL1]QJP14592.1 GntR family transcriptional regulator [Starkeya sp. ORNL1]
MQKTIDRPRRDITDELAARILAHIRESSLQYGAHLPAQELADRFNVSRSPVTQALRVLTEKQILSHVANRGFYVAAAAVPQASDVGLSETASLSGIYFQMAKDRLRGDLEDQVSERALRQRYNLSRGEVSELLDRAAQEGWVERRPGYGWSFSPVLTTPLALEQSYRVRLALEPATLLEPTFYLPRALAEKERERERQLIAGEIETISPDALYERGVRFHETLAEASQNPFFLDVLRRINRMRRLFTYQAMEDRKRYYGQVRDHIRILDLLIENRNVEAADLMRRHIERVLRNVRKIKPKL